MGGSGKWLKAFLGLKKAASRSSSSEKEDHIKSDHVKSKRWRLWKPIRTNGKEKSSSISEDLASSFSSSPTYSDAEKTLNARVARLAGGTSCLAFQALQEEWAATRIQTAFRRFLARKALRALKGLVRLQALIRGHQVRRQASITLRCMQALVRVQARVRARQVRMSKEGQAVQEKINKRRLIEAQISASEKGWCDANGTVEEIQVKLQQKQDGAMKRERAMAYAFANQWRAKNRPNNKIYFNYEPEKSHWGWSWLERWMAARPWENRTYCPGQLQDEAETISIKSSDDMQKVFDRSQVNVKKNKVSVRITPSNMHAPSHSSHTLHTDSSPTCSSRGTPTSTSITSTMSNSYASLSHSIPLKAVSRGDFCTRPGYMAVTESARAKCRAPSYHKLHPALDRLAPKTMRLEE